MFVNGVGIPTATEAAITAAAVGAISTAAVRLIVGPTTVPTTGLTI